MKNSGLIACLLLIAATSSFAAGVSVVSPVNGVAFGSPVHFVASASGSQFKIASMIIYVDNQIAYTTFSGSLDTFVSMGPGAHNIIVKSWEDVIGTVYQQTMSINVVSGGAVVVNSPVSGTNVGSLVRLAASSAASAGRRIAAMIAYVDNVNVSTAFGGSLDTFLTMGPGQHSITVKAWEDGTGAIFQQNISVNVGGPQIPQSRHVVVISEENHSYEDVMAQAPYLKSLADSYASATQFYSDRHSSLPALFAFVGEVLTTNNESISCYDGDNITRRMKQSGLRWRMYQDGLPFPGYMALTSPQGYLRRHNPLLYYSESCGGDSSPVNVPFDYIWPDLAAGNLPALSYITPNTWNDMHDGSIQAGDSWLAYAVPPILRRPEFQPGGDGLLIIFFDEGNLGTDNRCSSTVASGCGGRVVTVFAGPRVKRQFQSSITYRPDNFLATLCSVLGTSCPTSSSPMADMFSAP
jgi:acid phosphatase